MKAFKQMKKLIGSKDQSHWFKYPNFNCQPRKIKSLISQLPHRMHLSIRPSNQFKSSQIYKADLWIIQDWKPTHMINHKSVHSEYQELTSLNTMQCPTPYLKKCSPVPISCRIFTETAPLTYPIFTLNSRNQILNPSKQKAHTNTTTINLSINNTSQL